MATVREQLGCWVHERWRAEFVLRFPRAARACGLSWLDLSNRRERLTRDAVTGGRVCAWTGSSELTLPRVFPAVGRRLLGHMLAQWPVAFNWSGDPVRAPTPEISVIIAVSGDERLRLLQATLASLRAQRACEFEIIVVEQGTHPVAADQLPRDVRYIFKPSRPGAEFNKSWGLNVGARAARGKYLAIHDGDYIVPVDYLALCSKFLRVCEAVRPARLTVHLDRQTTERLLAKHALPTAASIDKVVANNPTPLAIAADAYWRIGGHDESFFGWGGEDDELLSRLRTLSVAEGGRFPVLHLWHPPAFKKQNGHRNRDLFSTRMSQPVDRRITALRQLHLGSDHPQVSPIS